MSILQGAMKREVKTEPVVTPAPVEEVKKDERSGNPGNVKKQPGKGKQRK